MRAACAHRRAQVHEDNVSNDRPLPVYDFPVREAAYWDALDTRVRCDDCANAVGISRCMSVPRTQEPPGLPHHCAHHARIARRPAQ